MLYGDQVIRGIKLALILKDTSMRQVCMKAGVHERTLGRFMRKSTDIRLDTLHLVVAEGLGMTIPEVYALGSEVHPNEFWESLTEKQIEAVKWQRLK